MVYGYSSLPTTMTAADTLAIDALIDQIRWLKLKLAQLTDQYVEPEDIEMDDIIKNREREA